jgi:hypothetical protein
MLSDNVAQQAGRLRGFKAAVEVNSGSYVAMAQEAANCLVIAGMLLQVDGGRGMAMRHGDIDGARALAEASLTPSSICGGASGNKL